MISLCRFSLFFMFQSDSKSSRDPAVTRASRSPDGAIHHEVDRGASWELSDGALLHGRVDFDLSHVSVAAVLVVGEHGDLDHESADGLVCALETKTKT